VLKYVCVPRLPASIEDASEGTLDAVNARGWAQSGAIQIGFLVVKEAYLYPLSSNKGLCAFQAMTVSSRKSSIKIFFLPFSRDRLLQRSLRLHYPRRMSSIQFI
jgi:hypothetical protein